MRNRVLKKVVMASVAVLIILGGFGPGFQKTFAASVQASTNYKVFQKWGDNQYHQVNSFNDLNSAIAYAKLYANVKITDTQTGLTVYDNSSYYDVFQKFGDNQDHLIKAFNDLNSAIAYAKLYANAKILDTHSGLTVYDNSSSYNVFQKFGDNQYHLIKSFSDLNSATTYAKLYANAKILDTHLGLTVYDNSSSYNVFQKFSDNQYHLVKSFNDLNSAIAYSKLYAKAKILDTHTGLTVYDNNTYYDVFQKFGDNQYHLVNGFNDYNSTLAYAKLYANAKIVDTHTGLTVYDNSSNYDVFQKFGDNQYHLIKNVNDYTSAAAYAKLYANAEIMDTHTGLVVYDNSTNYNVFQKWGDNQYHLINSYNDYNTAVAYAKLYANTKILGTHTGSVTYYNQQGSVSVPTLPNVPSKANATAWIKQAMAITNTPSMYLNDLLIIAYYESGYNPNAINKWDINWIEGHPSKGLMQVIPSTFEKYRNKSLPDNIFDPVANTVAAINYLNARYHGIANDPGIKSLQNGHGYIGY